MRNDGSRGAGPVFLALAIVVLMFQAHRAPAQRYDLLITGGHVLDGTGNPWFSGTVAIKGGKIVEVGRIPQASARRVIDAHGYVVTPGFIDLHSHSDYSLLVDGKAESKIRQGVTTEILGESESAGPIVGNAAASELDRTLAIYGLHRDWNTLSEYFGRVQRQGISVNIASYVGSGQVRMDVIGPTNRAPSQAEMEEMKKLVDQAMREGAIGLGSGLIYPPNAYASTAELIELARVIGQYGGIYSTHLRTEGAGEPAAIDEALEIGRQANVPVHILHLKSYGPRNWGRMAQLANQIQAARDQGLDVTADQYPYIASETGLVVTLPPKYQEGTTDEIVQRLKDPQTRGAIRKELAGGPSHGSEAGALGDWHSVLLGSIQNADYKKYEGKRVDEIAQLMGKDPVDAVCDLLIADGRAAAIYFAMSEDDVRVGLKQPWVGIGSDGQAVSPEMKFMGKSHPRYYGTFPRILGEYVREQKVLTLPDAIRKLTSLAAQIVGFSDRGLIRPGMAADVVIFDPARIADKATFTDSSQYPVGIEYVIVNGAVVIDQGRHTGAMPGRVLYGRGRE